MTDESGSPEPDGHRPPLHFRPTCGFTLIELLTGHGNHHRAGGRRDRRGVAGRRWLDRNDAVGTGHIGEFAGSCAQPGCVGGSQRGPGGAIGSRPAWLFAVRERGAPRSWRSPAWIPVDDWLQLPTGVYILPPTEPSGTLIAPGVDWTGLRSSAFSTVTETVNSVPCLVLSFTPRGTVSGVAGASCWRLRMPPSAGSGRTDSISSAGRRARRDREFLWHRHLRR